MVVVHLRDYVVYLFYFHGFKYILIDFTAKLASFQLLSSKMLHILGYWTGKILAIRITKI